MQQHLLLRFAHRCQYMACCAMDCALCKNNVHKRCAEGEHFAACYVQSAELRARCGGSISMQLVNASSQAVKQQQQQQQLVGMRIQLSVVDGSPRRSSSSGSGSTGAALARELLRSDSQAAAAAAIAGPFLLGANMELCQHRPLQELLRSKGIQRHKFLFLRSFLADRVVHDDDEQRVWFPDGPGNRGLLLACRQGQVNMQEPMGFVEWTTSSSGQPSLHALAATAASDLHALRSWAVQAQEDWARPGHPGWDVLSHLLARKGRTPLPAARAAAGTAGASAAVQHASLHDSHPSFAMGLVSCNTAPGGCTQHSHHHHPALAHPSDPWGLTYPTVSTPVGYQLQSYPLQSATSVSSSPFEHTSLSALLPSSSEPTPSLHPSGSRPLPSHLAAMRAMREQKPGSWPRSAAAAAHAAAIASSLSMQKPLLKASGSGGGASPCRLASAHQALLTSDLVGHCPQQQHYQPQQQPQQYQQQVGHTSPFSDVAVFELTSAPGTGPGTGLRRLATVPAYTGADPAMGHRESRPPPPLVASSSASYPLQLPPVAVAAHCTAVTWPAPSLTARPSRRPVGHAVRTAPAPTSVHDDSPLDGDFCPWPVPETVSTSAAVGGPAVEGTAAASGRKHQRTPSEPAAEDLWQLLLDAMDTTPL